MHDWLTHAFALVCGQDPEHLWAPGGIALPCCQRCTGLYAGAVLALVLHWLLKPPSTTAWRWTHGMFLLQMVPFGFHWVPQGPMLRTVTGLLFGFGLVAYLRLGFDEVTKARRLNWSQRRISQLLARADLGVITEARAATPASGIVDGDVLRSGPAVRAPVPESEMRLSHGCYAMGLLLSLLLLPAAARWGGQTGAVALSILAVLGAVTLLGLALMNLVWGIVAVLKGLLRPNAAVHPRTSVRTILS